MGHLDWDNLNLDAICEGIEQDEENRRWEDEEDEEDEDVEFVDLNELDSNLTLGFCTTCNAEEQPSCQDMGHNILHDFQEEDGPEEDFDAYDESDESECNACYDELGEFA